MLKFLCPNFSALPNYYCNLHGCSDLKGSQVTFEQKSIANHLSCCTHFLIFVHLGMRGKLVEERNSRPGFQQKISFLWFSSSLWTFEIFFVGFHFIFLAIFLKKKWPKLSTLYNSDCTRNLDIRLKGDLLLVRACQKGKCPIQGVMNKQEVDQHCTISLAAMSDAWSFTYFLLFSLWIVPLAFCGVAHRFSR